MTGKLHVIYGPMFSGKSTELLRQKHRAELAGKRVGLFKPRIDNRYSQDSVVTHDGLSHTAYIVEDGLDLLNTVVFSRKPAGFTDIFIDEVQFFNKDFYLVVQTLLNGGVNVYVAGLNTDFRGEPFPALKELLVRADYATRLFAVCKLCGSYEATMTQRLVNGKPAKITDPVIVLGGEESYEARCRDCFRVED